MKSKLKTWVDNLKKAWVEKNTDIIENICSDEVIYYEDPNLDPLNKLKVIEEWKRALNNQRDITFDYKIIVDSETNGVVSWTAAFTHIDTNDRVEMSGIFVINLVESGQCSEFHQWWVVKPS